MARLYQTLAVLGGPVEGPPFRIEGPDSVEILSVDSAIDSRPGSLTFAVKTDFLRQAAENGASAVILPQSLLEIAQKLIGSLNKPMALVVASDPRLLFAVMLGLVGSDLIPSFAEGSVFFKDKSSVDIGPGVKFGPMSYVGANVKIGANTVVGPKVFIEDSVEVGSDCLLHPGVILRWGVKIGHRCQIHSNSVIGEDGFGYNQIPFPEKGRLIHYKNPHLGSVVIQDDVEIGALSAVDRGLVSNTFIGRGTKIDNLVQIGHNCQIGQDCVIVSQVGAAGHSQVGDRAFLLGQSGLSHGASVGCDAIVSGQSGVLGRVPPGRAVWTGTPIKTQGEEYRAQVMIKNDLPKWRRFLNLFLKGKSLEEIREDLTLKDGPEVK
ncbi:MAG: UDP-3-O-(3-hydroxymyristoyl)glucosamine N-acyltransferase [Deltaproteobacteria bacterium]|nr:UDP-3-O-(3-hydroxymyristoyl)glucosamine N-acyltransferase [Deltaproteobacteria bacterium]